MRRCNCNATYRKSVFSFAGRFTHHLEDAQLIVPRKVNDRGELVSHRLTHHHHHHHPDADYSDGQDLLSGNFRRVRRDVQREEEEERKLHYHVDVDNQTLHLVLE